MRNLLILFQFLLLSGTLKSQTDSVGISPYKCGIGLLGINKVNKVVQGEIYSVSDSGIILKTKVKGRPLSKDSIILLPVHLSKIDYITVKKKGKSEQGFLVGALTGFVIGGAIGLADGDDPEGIFSFSAEEKALMTGTAGLLFGGLTGLVIGASKKVIRINGNTERFNEIKDQLKSYSIHK